MLAPGPGPTDDRGADDPVVWDPTSVWVRWLLVVLTAVVLPTVLVAFAVVRSPAFSPLDEPVHADYLRRIEAGEVPRVGDKVLLETVRDVQCRTVRGHTNAPCGLPLEEYFPDMLGAAGYQYEAQQPPLYYAVTAVVRPLATIGPADEFVTTARLVGAAWLSAGLLVFWVAARRLGCGWWATALLAALLALSPGVLHQAATVNNDAAAVLTGSLAVLMFASLRERASPLVAVGWGAVAVALVMIKPTGIISVAAAGAALLLDAALDRRLQLRAAVLYVVPVVAGLAAYLAWGQIRDARATVDYDIVLDALLSFKKVDSLPLDDVVATVSRLTAASAAGSPVAPNYVTGPALLVVYVLLAASIATLWVPRLGSAAQRLGSMAVVALVVGGPAFTVLFYIDYSVEGGPHSRYGLSLLPLLAAAAAAVSRTRRSIVVLAALVALMLGATSAALA